MCYDLGSLVHRRPPQLESRRRRKERHYWCQWVQKCLYISLSFTKHQNHPNRMHIIPTLFHFPMCLGSFFKRSADMSRNNRRSVKSTRNANNNRTSGSTTTSTTSQTKPSLVTQEPANAEATQLELVNIALKRNGEKFSESSLLFCVRIDLHIYCVNICYIHRVVMF